MPMLQVRCTKCKELIPTELDVDYETFRNLTETERTLECPHCGKRRIWRLDDVDRSVFRNT